jgi:hypothetical protein
MKKNILFFMLVLFTAGLSAQVAERNKCAFSLSWAPSYSGPNFGGYNKYALIPMSFEADAHFSFIKNLSLSAGAGFNSKNRTFEGWSLESVIDPAKYKKEHMANITLPVSVSYNIGGDKFLPHLYLKAEFINEFCTFITRSYQDNVFIKSTSFSLYYNSAYLGVGDYISATDRIALLTEVSIGSPLYNDPFACYYLKVKIGLLIK